VVVNGDLCQSDVGGANGLADAIGRLQGLPRVCVHRFEREDIVRSGLVRDIIDRYEPAGAGEGHDEHSPGGAANAVTKGS